MSGCLLFCWVGLYMMLSIDLLINENRGLTITRNLKAESNMVQLLLLYPVRFHSQYPLFVGNDSAYTR